tara:strand:- start:1422 stop:2240 length:819 start_codon:yes stop_codon:yes gene_type:complete
MNIAINASNTVLDSGGFTHLKELLRNYEAKEKEIIYVASSSNVIDELKINNKKVKYILSLFVSSRNFFKVIPHGIQKKFFREFKKKNSDKKFKILYVSKYEKYKNQLNFVKVCYVLKKVNFDVSLTLFGLYREKNLLNSDLYKFINKINLKFKDLMIIKNFKKHKNLINMHLKFDLKVYLSKCEAFGLIILEIIASSLPIICSNYSVYKEILKRNTIYFDPDNPHDIANSIKVYIINFKRKFKNTKNLFKIAKKFNWKTSFNETFNFIKEIS